MEVGTADGKVLNLGEWIDQQVQYLTLLYIHLATQRPQILKHVVYDSRSQAPGAGSGGS